MKVKDSIIDLKSMNPEDEIIHIVWTIEDIDTSLNMNDYNVRSVNKEDKEKILQKAEKYMDFRLGDFWDDIETAVIDFMDAK